MASFRGFTQLTLVYVHAVCITLQSIFVCLLYDVAVIFNHTFLFLFLS